jgi:[amino-group carrier protein]-gamma-(L-lysyl/L-ornithyl)-L-glutamate aminotransferase
MTNVLTDLTALEDTHSSGVYVKREITLVRGDGATLWDDAGNRYIDCAGGQGAANLGHSHPAVLAAIERQMHELITCPEAFHNPVRAEYQAELCRASGMSRVFLCNSGAEAIEGALKFARLATGRTGYVAAMRGFHGRTMGALSITWEKNYREPFEPLISGVRHIPYNNVEKLAAALDDTVAAAVLEIVQGEGGVHPAQAGYLQAAQELCRKNGSLLIIDEIQTGFGRTGCLFAYQYEGIQPDLVCLAKSMAGGLPMGAVLIGEQVGQLPPASHGSTFGGNPLACAAGLAVLDVLERGDSPHPPTPVASLTGRGGEKDSRIDLVGRAAMMGEKVIAHFRERLPEKAVREVRGRGLMIGIELRGKVAPVLKALQTRGVLALPAGPTVLRLLPPLVINEEVMWQAVSIIEEVVSAESV